MSSAAPATPYRVVPKNNTPAHDAEFAPPPVEPGWHVLFYVDADKNSSPYIAYVRAVDKYCLTLESYERGAVRMRQNVRHVDDPRASTPTMRQWGGWGLIHSREMQEIEKLEQRVAQLEKLLSEGTAGKKDRTGN
jgi:hypothetical protein